MITPVKTRFGALFLAAVFLASALSAPLSYALDKTQWRTGRLLAADLRGHGPASGNKPPTKRSDIWWVYCISEGEKAYSAVSRVSPAKAGLTVNSPIKFSVDRYRIQILNSKGERFVMRIVRQGDESICH